MDDQLYLSRASKVRGDQTGDLLQHATGEMTLIITTLMMMNILNMLLMMMVQVVPVQRSVEVRVPKPEVDFYL